MYQVLLNLCLNARDAMPRGGTLTLSGDEVTVGGERRVRLQVRDTGVGIPAEFHAKIFEPFFTTKAVGKGSGLGLATTRRLVEGMGGTVAVQSAAGQGATFTLTFPPADDPPVSPSAMLEQMPAGRDELVLVIDEEASFRELARRTLEAEGYRVLAASKHGEALDQAAAAGPRLAVVLHLLPSGPAGTSLQAVQKMAPAARLVSTYLPPRGEWPAGLRGVAHLKKPFTAAEMLRAIHEAVLLRQTAGVG